MTGQTTQSWFMHCSQYGIRTLFRLWDSYTVQLVSLAMSMQPQDDGLSKRPRMTTNIIRLGTWEAREARACTECPTLCSLLGRQPRTLPRKIHPGAVDHC